MANRKPHRRLVDERVGLSQSFLQDVKGGDQAVAQLHSDWFGWCIRAFSRWFLLRPDGCFRLLLGDIGGCGHER